MLDTGKIEPESDVICIFEVLGRLLHIVDLNGIFKLGLGPTGLNVKAKILDHCRIGDSDIWAVERNRNNLSIVLLDLLDVFKGKVVKLRWIQFFVVNPVFVILPFAVCLAGEYFIREFDFEGMGALIQIVQHTPINIDAEGIIVKCL